MSVKEITASAYGQHQGREGKTNVNIFCLLREIKKEVLSYGCSCVHCELNWNSVVLFTRRVEIRKTLRKTSRSKGSNQ